MATSFVSSVKGTGQTKTISTITSNATTTCGHYLKSALKINKNVNMKALPLFFFHFLFSSTSSSPLLESSKVQKIQKTQFENSRSYRQIFCDEPFTTDILAQALHYSKFRHNQNPKFNKIKDFAVS